MQGKQAMANLERKGPHKSMHCKFCKPPGVTTPEKPTRAQLETKTRIHLAHEAADLRLCNVHNEPGFPAVESEACICILEGDNPCPKCAPDKNRPPPKKKVCRCPKGAKPHPSMFDGTVPKKKKQVEEDDEFWWEKYSREHDAIARETWAAYMAQRRKDKKLHKCQIREAQALALKDAKGRPVWYQKLSCQQMIYVEFLSTAIRLDSDENITDRTYYVLGGLGLYPRPQRKLLKRCLRYCHYNALRFLNQLQMLTKDDDPFNESAGKPKKTLSYTWNEKLIMNSVCHLEFPALLRELMDRLPPLPREDLLPQIPYPVFPKLPNKRYDSPYEEPIWQDRLNWVEKTKIDRLNRCRAYMDTKRVKIPALALVRRPSLIDARPPFLSQIEANERASRRLVEEKVQRPVRKHKISTFNSAVDVTAIAGIEASEISTTDKADTDDICVFLREPKEPESMEGETEEAEFFPEKEVRFLEEPKEETQVKALSEFGEYSEEEAGEDIPFRTPPKTESGRTIQSPCAPPDATPGPPAHHYDRAKRDIDVVNEEICGFFPFVSSSTQTVKDDFYDKDEDVESKLRSAAEKLKKFADEESETESPEPKSRKRKKRKAGKKCRCRARRRKAGAGRGGRAGRRTVVEMPYYSQEGTEGEEEGEGQGEGEGEGKGEEVPEELEQEVQVRYGRREEEKGAGEKESEGSDPDPDTEDEWSSRLPCTTEAEEAEAGPGRRRARGRGGRGRGRGRRRGRKAGRKARKRKGARQDRGMELREETGEYLRRREPVAKAEKETMTECYPGEYDYLYQGGGGAEEGQEEEGGGRDVFRGRVEPLVQEILKDLAEEGFVSASYKNVHSHPLINQLILYLQGEMLTKKLREKLQGKTQVLWGAMKGLRKFPLPELGISSRRQAKANWNEKKWIARVAKKKKDEFFFKVAKSWSEYAKEVYEIFHQEYFGTDRYLKIFYAYMTAKYEDAILRGVV